MEVQRFVKPRWSKGPFHFSELTGQRTIPVAMRISLLIKTIHPDQSSLIIVCTKEMGLHQKLSAEKAYFIVKMTGPTIIRPASSDFWKCFKLHFV